MQRAGRSGHRSFTLTFSRCASQECGPHTRVDRGSPAFDVVAPRTAEASPPSWSRDTPRFRSHLCLLRQRSWPLWDRCDHQVDGVVQRVGQSHGAVEPGDGEDPPWLTWGGGEREGRRVLRPADRVCDPGAVGGIPSPSGLWRAVFDSPPAQPASSGTGCRTGRVPCLTVLPGELSCGITLRRDHGATTVASSDSRASQVDEIQYSQDAGPCVRSLATGQVVVDDLAQDDRWGATG